MSALRFRPRHLQQTVYDNVQTWLSNLSWFASGGFKTVPVTLIDYVPEERSGKPIAPNTVGVTLGAEDADQAEELGGGLWSVATAVFVDVYGENQAIALSLAADLKDLFVKRPGIVLYDYTQTPAVPTDERVEFTDTIREKPLATDFRPNWQVVKTTATVFYAGDE